MHSDTKTELLRLLKNGDQSAAIQAVLLSDLLPDDLLQRWLDGLIERAIRCVIGLPACPQWTGRAAWEVWAVKRLHSKDRDSQASRRATEKVIALTAREAQEKWDRRTGQLNPAIQAAAEAARLSLLPCSLALESPLLVGNVALNADVATYGAVCLAPTAEREAQHRELLDLINGM